MASTFRRGGSCYYNNYRAAAVAEEEEEEELLVSHCSRTLAVKSSIVQSTLVSSGVHHQEIMRC